MNIYEQKISDKKERQFERSPTRTAWVRMLNSNGRYAVKLFNHAMKEGDS